jgi:uncharacterized membrane protein
METGRLETFADGVFAIAATLLILNVRLIPTADCTVLSCQILHAWPSYVAYAVSFLTIGIIWVNHHNVMRQIAKADRTFLMITVLFLMVVAFIPFPTQLVAEHISGAFDDAQAATVTYGITLTLTAVGALDRAARAAEGRTLTKGPRGGGRDLEKIAAHVGDAEGGYLYALGTRPPKDADTRRTIERVLLARSRGEPPERVPRTGKLWSPRYFARRTAWHALDHAWEIEDRLQPND